MNELATISKLQSAKLAVQEVKELDEIKRIVDQSEALRNYARAQRLSTEIQDDVAEYALYATRQMGVISHEMEKESPGRKVTELLPEPGIKSKTETLAAAGIDIRRANEAEKLAAVPEERFAEIIAEKRESGELTKTAVMEAVTKPHVANNSGNDEWYTPQEYIDAARSVMGDIDLDPASSDVANKVVGAKTYYTAEDDGLSKDWHGRVWMNPPYAADLIPRFVDKLSMHYQHGGVDEAIVLVNNATETVWFNELVSVASAVIFPKSRVRFYMPDGKTGAPLQGQAVLYLGRNPGFFMMAFSSFGWGAYLREV